MPGASAYTFTTDIHYALHFIGAGIVINGGSAAITDNGVLGFLNTSTAGNASIANNYGLTFADTQYGQAALPSLIASAAP